MISGANRLGFWFKKPNDFSISWTTSQSGITPYDPGGWSITNSNLRATFYVQDSVNCGGYNQEVQEGVAIARIYTGQYNYNMAVFVDGLGETYSSNHDRINVYLAGHQWGQPPLGTLLSAGGSTGGTLETACSESPLIVDYYELPPYYLFAYKSYTLTLNYSTIDNLYHKNVYAEVDLQFFAIP